MTEKETDIFILHDSRDKNFTDPLYSRLKAKNLKVWYDKASLEIGNSLTEKIEEGIKNCNYGILILSKNLLNNDRYAGKYELPSFKIRQIIENKEIILPIWLDINEKELSEFSPWLADKVALKVSDGMDNVIDKIFRKVQKIGKWITTDMSTGLKGTKDQKGGIWYGTYRYLIFANTDKGNLLKVEVKSAEHKLRIELWNGTIKQNDDHWWDHHSQKEVSVGTRDKPKIALDQKLEWTIEPGNYTLFFASNSPNGIIIPHNISYKIDIDNIPILTPTTTQAPLIPTTTQAPIYDNSRKEQRKINKLQPLDYKKWEQIRNKDSVTIDNINYIQLGNYYQAKLIEYNIQTQTAIVAILMTENHIEYYYFKGSMPLQLEEYGLYIEEMNSEYIFLKIGRLPF